MNLKRNISQINLVIAAVMFIVLMTMAGLGFMIKFVLLPGYKANEVYGRNIDLRFLNLDRHQWGFIHLYLSLFFLFLLLVHIILHRGMIICIFRNMFSGVKTRLVLSLSVGSVGLILPLGPFFIKPEVTQFHGRNIGHKISDGNKESDYNGIEKYVPDKAEPRTKDISESDRQANLESRDESITFADSDMEEVHHDQHGRMDINGMMTLRDVAKKYNIGIEELAKPVKVPPEYADERLGRLKKRYGFELNELRDFVYGTIKR